MENTIKISKVAIAQIELAIQEMDKTLAISKRILNREYVDINEIINQ